MMKRKFTDDEIVNKKWDMNMSCTPWSNEKERADYYENLYKEQLAENERLEVELKAMRGSANSYKSEVERLQKEVRHNYAIRDEAYKMLEDLEKAIPIQLAKAKSEAIKEFVEKLEHALKLNKDDGYGYVAYLCDIRNLVKEMTGENNGN